MNEQSAFIINEESHEKIVRENEEEKRKELKRKKTNAHQRAYYQRQKELKKNEEIIKKVPKSNAERQRKFRQRNAEKSYMDMEAIVKSAAAIRQKEYRMRKKIEKERLNPKKKPKTNAQNQQQFRQNQKMKPLSETEINAKKKKDAERAKTYRNKLKSRKEHYELNSLLSSEIEKQIDHSHGTNYEELIGSQCLMQTNKMQPAMNNETQQAISPRFQSFQAAFEEHDIHLLRHKTNITDDDRSKIIPACATGQSSLSAPASSEVEEILIKIEPLERQDKSEVIHASSSGQVPLDDTAVLKEKRILIKTEPSSTQDKSKVLPACATGPTLLSAPSSSKVDEIFIKVEPLEREDKSKVLPACATGPTLLSAPSSSKVDEIFIKVEPLEREEESGVINASSIGQSLLDANATSTDKGIPIRAEPSNTQDMTDYWNKLRQLAVKFGSNSPRMPAFWASMEVPPLAPISAPASTSVSETVSATDVTTAQKLRYRILCCMCQKICKGFIFVCVQCDYKACKECDEVAHHYKHYVLRIPTRANREEIEAVVTKIDELVSSGTLLAAENKAKTKMDKKRAPVQSKTTANKNMCIDTILEQKTILRPERNRNSNQGSHKKTTIPKSATENSKVKKSHPNVETQKTIHENMEYSQIPERGVAEKFAIKKGININCEKLSTLPLNIKQESGLTEEEISSLHTIKEDLDDITAGEHYLDATVPLGDHAYTVMPSHLPVSQAVCPPRPSPERHRERDNGGNVAMDTFIWTPVHYAPVTRPPSPRR